MRNQDLLAAALTREARRRPKPQRRGFLSFIASLQRERGYRWDGAKAQYVSKWNSRAVSETTVRRAIERYNTDLVGSNMLAQTERFLDGSIDLATWQTRMAQELKDAHIVNLQIGRGGQAATTFSDYGGAGARLRFQYGKLNGFAQDIFEGKMSQAQIRQRVQMYANSVRTSYFSGLSAAKTAAGYTHEQRFVNSAQPCEVCSAQASRGKVPIGTLPEPGEDCLGYTNCLCTKEYFREEDEGGL